MWRRESDLSRYTPATGEYEPNLSFHLALELLEFFPLLSCDFDVRKHAGRPDLIFHRRGTHAANFLVIEVKRERSSAAVSADLDQMRHWWFAEPLVYCYGASVVLDDERRCAEIAVFRRDAEGPLEFVGAETLPAAVAPPANLDAVNEIRSLTSTVINAEAVYDGERANTLKERMLALILDNLSMV